MNVQPKHDWRAVVRQSISPSRLPAGQREEIISELAAHLEERYETAVTRGLCESAAVDVALQEVTNWHELAGRIRRAKSTEVGMSQLTKRVILPALAMLWLAGVILILLDRAALLQCFIWIACIALLVCAAAFESNRLNQRTRCFWLPGFITLSAASLFLLSTDFLYDFSRFFREITLHPQDLLRWNTGSPRSVYFLWLLGQAAFGAVGAFFSRRAGGTRTVRLVAGTFPVTLIVGTYVLMVPVTCLITGDGLPSPLPTYLGAAMCVWVLAPAVSVALGAAPFLRSNKVAGAFQPVV